MPTPNSSVDTKIVEMQFDNAKFERNIRQSMKSLNELKGALEMKDAGKGFEKLEKTANNMDFSKMEKSLSFLEYRFSALGMTAAKIIDKTTDKIGGLFTKINNLTIGQIKSGGMARALKLEHANFMLDGILKDAEKVKDIMDNAVSPAVDGTAYGLDAAANAASQFVASGIEDVEKLKTALTGISGVAAMSGSEYEDIARIFTKVAASGKMMGDEVMQLSTRGINAQSELAKYLNKTVSEVQEMQKKGQISFEIFSNAMNDAFGEQAKKANDTFTGAMSNLKAALSRIGADFATPYINNMRDIFNALRLTVNDVRKALQPLVKIWTAGITGFKSFVETLTQNEKFINLYKQSIYNICRAIEILTTLTRPLADGFKKAFPEGMVGLLSDFADKIAAVMNNLQFRTAALNDLSDAVGGLFSILKLIGHIIDEITGQQNPLFSGVNNFLGLIAKLLGILGRVITKTVDLIITGKKGAGIIETIKKAILIVISVVIMLVTEIANFIRTAKDLPIVQDIFNGLYDAAVNLANFALPLLAGAAGAVVGAFSYLIDLGKSGFFSNLFTKVTDKIKSLHDTMEAGSGAISSFTDIFRGGFKKLPWTITAYAKSVDKLKTTMGDTTKRGGVVGAILNINNAFDTLSDTLKNISSNIFQQARKFGVARGIIVGTGAALIAFLAEGAGVARNFKKAFGGIPGVISALKNNLNANIFDVKAKAIILGLAVAIGSLTLSLVALSMVDSTKLKTAALSLSLLIGVMSVAGVLVNKLGGGFKGFQAVAISFMSFAGAVGILVVALATLAKIDLDFGELMKRVLALAAIMAALGGVIIAMTQWSKPFSVLLGSGFMLAFALAIKMLVSSLQALGDMKLDKISAALPILLKMMGTLALIGAACTMLSPLAGFGFMGIVAGIIGFIYALNKLAEVIDPDKFYYIHTLLQDIYDAVRGWLVLFGIAVVLVAVKKLIFQIGKTVAIIRGGLTQLAFPASILVGPLTIFAKAVKAFSTAAVIGALVGGLVLIAHSIEYLSKAVNQDEFILGCQRAATIAVGISIFLGSIMLMQKLLLGKKQFLSGLEKIGLSLAVLLASLTFTMKTISDIPDANLDKAIWYVGVLMIIVTGFEAVSAVLAKDSKAIQMSIKAALSLSILITALTLSVGLLSMLAEENWTGIMAAAGSVTVLMLGIAAVCWALGQVKTGPAIAATVGIVAVLAAVAAALYVIKDIKFDENYTNMFVALVSTIGYMVVLFALLSQLDSKKALVGAGAMAALAIVFAVFAGVFKIIESISFDKVLPNLVAIGASISYLSLISAGIGSMIKQVALGELALAGLVAIFWGFAEVANIIKSIDTSGLIANLQVLAVAITTLMVVVAVLGGLIVGTGGTAGLIFLAGAAALAVFIGEMNLLADVAQGFALAAQMTAEALLTFSEGITALGVALSDFAHQDMTGIMDNLMSALGVIAGFSLMSADISALASSFKDLSEGITSVSEMVEAVNTLGEKLPTLVQYIKELKSALTDLTTALNGAITALSSDQIYGVVTNLADTMKLYLEADFNSVGVQAMQHIIAGMKSEIEASVPPIMNDVISGLKAGAFNAESELTSLGAELAQYLIAGFRGPDGLDAHSPARKFIAAMIDVVGGIKTGSDNGKSDVNNAGASLGAALVDGFRGPNGIDAHSDSKKFLAAVGDAIGGILTGVMQGKGLVEAAFAELGKKSAEKYGEGIEDNKGAVATALENVVENAHNAAQDFLDGNPVFQEIRTYLNDPTGLLGKGWGSGAAAEDKKRADMFGYNSIEALTKAGQAGELKYKWAHKAKVSADALNQETKALGGNSKAAKSNTKAKEENEKANDGKTEAIDEETESLGEEAEATNENEEAIRAMAEQIEVVTEKYKELNAWFGWSNKFKIVGKEFSALGQAWSKSFKDVQRSSNGTETILKHTYREVASYFNEAKKTIPKTANKVAKGLYAFDAETDKLDKRLTKRLSNGSKSLKKITSTVQSTGKTVARVYEGYAKVYTKLGGGKTEKLTIRLTKNVKNLAKQAKAASDFVKNLNPNPNSNAIQYVEDLTDNLRKIENFFVKRQNMPKKVQDYLGGILSNFNKDFKYSMNILAKQIDGIGDYWKKGTQSTAYVADAFTQLAATLYDGSEAANQYWTEIERMRFLVEQGVEPAEKLEELYKSYLSRAVEALKEYKKQLDETIAGQFNPFEEFDEKVEDQTKDLLGCLESQIRGFERWGEGLNALAARGADFNLMKELADQGVESYGIMKNLLSMTAGELALYNKYYRMIDTVKQKASDAALAAVANARTQASLRAAAKSGKLSEKQMEKQRNIAKRMTDDIKSVAHAEVYYNSMTKKQEKEYLKTLNKKEKAKYKAEKKAAKRAKKEQERLAAEEEARRAEEYRVQTIMDTIKGYETLLKVMDEYCNDTNVMTKLNEKLDDSLSGVYKNLGKSVDVSRAWVKFADQLGAEGDDSESYFNSLKSTIESFRDGIKNALYDITRAFEEFKQDTDKKLNLNKMFSNTISQARASRLFGQYIEKMANMGYNSQIIEYIGKKFSSDQAGALAEMAQMVNATRQEITNLNASFKAYSDAMEKSMKQADQAVIRSQRDPQKEAFEAAQKRYKTAQDNLKKLTEETTDFDRLYYKTLKNSYTEETKQAMRDNMTIHGSSWDKTYNKQYQAYKKAVEQVLNTSSASIKTKLDTIKKLQERYGIKSENVYSGRAKEIYEQMQAATKRGDKELAAMLKRRLEAMTGDRFGDSIEARIAALQAEYEAALKAAKAEAANASAAYQRAQKIWQEEQALRARLEAERKAQEAYENALIDVAGLIEKFDELTAAIGKARWSTDYIRRTYVKLNAAIAPVSNAVAFAKERFADFEGTSKSALKDLSALEEGFFRLASTLDASNDEAGNLIDNLGARLEAYRKTLYDTIKGQVSLFDEFKKFSGEKATTANKYLDNMQSQINGVKEWLTNLEKLATMGVSGDVLKMFAEEGQGSFEKVAAFANATEEQIGELNAQYAEYMRLTDEAADRALATVGAAFSDGAIKMQDEMIAKFKASGAKRIADAAYEAGIMVVTGVKDGINAASPQIVYEIQGATQTINETLSKTLTSSAIEESIRKGLNTMSGALQNSVGVMVSDFLTNVTNTTVQKFKMAVDSCRAYVEATLPTDWNITIHVDTSEIDAAVARMNEAVAMTNFNAGQTSNTVTSSLANQQQAQVIGSQQPAAPNQTTVNYTQNNYSPKTLSRAEIYRQTQNQLSTITGVVNSANG